MKLIAFNMDGTLSATPILSFFYAVSIRLIPPSMDEINRQEASSVISWIKANYERKSQMP